MNNNSQSNGDTQIRQSKETECCISLGNSRQKASKGVVGNDRSSKII